MKMQIEEIRLIEKEDLKCYELKSELSEIELYGLEMILINLLQDYYEEMGLEDSAQRSYNEVDNCTRHMKDHLDILDGCYDVLHVGSYKITSIFLTNNNIPVAMCVKNEYENYVDDNSIYYVSVG